MYITVRFNLHQNMLTLLTAVRGVLKPNMYLHVVQASRRSPSCCGLLDINVIFLETCHEDYITQNAPVVSRE